MNSPNPLKARFFPAAADVFGSQPATRAASAPASATPSRAGRVLLIHGYSASGEDFVPWKDALLQAGVPAQEITIGNYVSLNNEVTIKDIGEGFDRALHFSSFAQAIGTDDWTFDAIVHSTGMLVLRQWLTSDPFPPNDPRSRIRRLKHVIGLAPATFGSPQARKGRSWIGALIKGNRQLGPDFLNAGNVVLDALELGSRFTWDLAHRDMLTDEPLYDKGTNTPYVAVFIGNSPYDGIARLASPKGSDGTVRWAGCALDSRKVTLDFRKHPRIDPTDPTRRCLISKWSESRAGAPMIAVDGRNHGTMISDPHPDVVQFVARFLQITTQEAYDAWLAEALNFGNNALDKMDRSGDAEDPAGWQQIIVHMADDHGDPVTDFNLQLYIGDSLDQSDDPDFAPIPFLADTYSTDNSYRCFYLQLTREMLNVNAGSGGPRKMWVELIASSGSKLIEYEAYTGSEDDPQRLAIDSHDPSDHQPVRMDITELTKGGASLLYPYTTTLLEILVQREPMPLNAVSDVFNFLQG